MSQSKTLAEFAANLRFEDIPQPVIHRAEDLFLDWFGSALAGKNARPIEAIESFAKAMGPADGLSEVLISRRCTTPLFAALVNAAASHFAEQDDVHNGAVFHPGTVVFPPAFAVAQTLGSSGRDLLTAAVAGYETGIRVGEFLGRSHYKVFHTTGTAGTIAAAAATGKLLALSPEQMLNAFGSAGTQAAGLWEFLRDAADSKQLHAAKAAADGLLAAYLARHGFTGARRIFEGEQGMAAGMSTDADPAKLVDGLGERWALLETSFKYHACCRHTHPAADALLKLISENQIDIDLITHVTAHVHQAAIDVLGAVGVPRTVHQAKFSMGTVLGLIALFRRAGLREFEEHYTDPRVTAFRDKVEMALDPEVEQAYPARWIGKVTIETTSGLVLHGRIDEPRGDPGNTLTRAELEEKALRLADYSGAATPAEMSKVFMQIRDLANTEELGEVLNMTLPARSYLFVPGNRPERFAKAYASGADAVIIDLEDAVPPGERVTARANIATWVSPEHPVLIRVNGANTEWFREDIAIAALPGVAGIVLPKAERTEDVERIGKPVLPIIETARGFWNVVALAHIPNVERLMFGSIDFQLDLGISGDGEELLYFRSQLVLVSRLAGLPAPVDGITAVFDLPGPVIADTQRARRLGFGGKLCIHPKQVATVNECFGPTPAEEAWARRVVEAAATAGGAAISLDGEMIDRPVLSRALELLKQLREP